MKDVHTKEQVMFTFDVEKALFSGKTDHIENSLFIAAKENPQNSGLHFSGAKKVDH